jgi:tartrate-resistant acid phosphatase type 5
MRYRMLLYFSVLLTGIITACSETELIVPQGFDTRMESDTILFAVIGDYGKAGEPEEKVASMVKSWNPDFIITTGDNNYESGEMSTIQQNISQYYGEYIYNYDAPVEYQCKGKAFEEAINRFFPSPGNHDAGSREKLVPYLNFFTLPQQETFYKFVWGPVSFYSLNSVTGDLDEQEQWLFEQLDLSETPFNIVYFHHPPYSPGRHGNTRKMQWDYHGAGVDVVLAGHDHIYARVEKKGEEGLYYIVNGLGGKSRYDSNASPLPAGVFESYGYDADYGAIRATATSDQLVIEFYAAGPPKELIDSVVIEK